MVDCSVDVMQGLFHFILLRLGRVVRLSVFNCRSERVEDELPQRDTKLCRARSQPAPEHFWKSFDLECFVHVSAFCHGDGAAKVYFLL
jgi:hypothetical protein